MRRSFSHPEMATFLKSIKPTAEEVKIANKILEASGKKEEEKKGSQENRCWAEVLGKHLSRIL